MALDTRTRQKNLGEFWDSSMGVHGLAWNRNIGFKVRGIEAMVVPGYYEFHFVSTKAKLNPKLENCGSADKAIYFWGDGLQDYMGELAENAEMTVGNFVDCVNERMEEDLIWFETESKEGDLNHEAMQGCLKRINSINRRGK